MKATLVVLGDREDALTAIRKNIYAPVVVSDIESFDGLTMRETVLEIETLGLSDWADANLKSDLDIWDENTQRGPDSAPGPGELVYLDIAGQTIMDSPLFGVDEHLAIIDEMLEDTGDRVWHLETQVDTLDRDMDKVFDVVDISAERVDDVFDELLAVWRENDLLLAEIRDLQDEVNEIRAMQEWYEDALDELVESASWAGIASYDRSFDSDDAELLARLYGDELSLEEIERRLDAEAFSDSALDELFAEDEVLSYGLDSDIGLGLSADERAAIDEFIGAPV